MMPSLSQTRSESQRIGFLLRRDGYPETRNWVERTAGLYRDALRHTNHYAADPTYRPLFEKAVREFEEWLASSRD
jgi:hypothetical protein